MSSINWKQRKNTRKPPNTFMAFMPNSVPWPGQSKIAWRFQPICILKLKRMWPIFNQIRILPLAACFQCWSQLSFLKALPAIAREPKPKRQDTLFLGSQKARLMEIERVFNDGQYCQPMQYCRVSSNLHHASYVFFLLNIGLSAF